jgi:hypothetical protein
VHRWDGWLGGQAKGTFRFHDEFGLAVDLIGNKRVDLKPLLTGTYPFEDASMAFEAASAWWQAVSNPEAAVLAVSPGSCSAQIEVAFQQRVRNRHPLGGLAGLGRSPCSTMRLR